RRGDDEKCCACHQGNQLAEQFCQGYGKCMLKQGDIRRDSADKFSRTSFIKKSHGKVDQSAVKCEPNIAHGSLTDLSKKSNPEKRKYTLDKQYPQQDQCRVIYVCKDA